jgi:hypothetical protein
MSDASAVSVAVARSGLPTQATLALTVEDELTAGASSRAC